MVGSCVTDVLLLCSFRVSSSDVKVRSDRNFVRQYAGIIGISYIVGLSNV